MNTATIAEFADYSPVNVCRICGSEAGQGRYCAYHARQVQRAYPQVQRVIQLARRRRADTVFAAFTLERIVARAMREG